MVYFNFNDIVEAAWQHFDASRTIKSVRDISVMVSTNHVYKVTFEDNTFVIGKLSYFGRYEHFVEDHTIINTLSTNLPFPFENVLSRSLVKGEQLYVYRHQDKSIDAWVVFYRPVKIKKRLPRRLSDSHIQKLGEQMALFHKACHSVRNTLPPSSKTIFSDLDHLLEIVDSDFGKYEHRGNEQFIKDQCAILQKNMETLNFPAGDKIPVFVDWNIGNFSVTPAGKLYSRWDYDWFRISSRMMDFYFLSRVVSDVGDRTDFTYNIQPLMEDRFILFLKSYHQKFPLTEPEIRMLPEVYRFFLLNYIIKDGRYFFHEIYASKFQQEAYQTHFPSIKKFSPDRLLKELGL